MGDNAKCTEVKIIEIELYINCVSKKNEESFHRLNYVEKNHFRKT